MYQLLVHKPCVSHVILNINKLLVTCINLVVAQQSVHITNKWVHSTSLSFTIFNTVF